MVSDAPLPETLIEFLAKGRPDGIEPCRAIMRAALAFRDSSGRRVVWGAEAVEPLIEALRDLVECIRDDTDTRHPLKRARAALARVRSPEPAGDTSGGVAATRALMEASNLQKMVDPYARRGPEERMSE